MTDIAKEQPTPQDVHIDVLGSGDRRKRKRKERRMPDAEQGILKEAVSLIARQLGVSSPIADETKKSEAVNIEVPIWKAEHRQIIYGVALDPSVTDSQGDDVSAEEIEKAAHKFMVESGKSDVQHDEVEAGVQLLESYIAPNDLEIEGHPVAKGAWVLAHKVLDPRIWERVTREDHPEPLTGYSIGGMGTRI